MRVVATAGHVDHGKSSLVLALTGTDPDRWEEEKRRGLTIDLGFAFMTLPSGRQVGFVDVPGHIRFLKNMLAGAGAVQAVVLVVTASEGWMPQTEEHLRILEVLGVRHGFTVLTMADVVDAEGLELAQLEVMEHLDGTFLEDAPLVACDSVSGRGVADVVNALDDLLGHLPPPVDDERPRLWIDRVFSARGAGTVVTGTLTGGSLAPGDEVTVAPPGVRGRVRSVQSGHEDAAGAEPGTRVALNLAGVDRDAVNRGDAVVREGQWVLTDVVDVTLTLLVGVDIPRRMRAKAYVGSGELDATIGPLGDRYARVRLARPLPLAPGDRMVLRDPGREITLGGAEILDAAPPRTARGAIDRLVLPLGPRLLASHPAVTTGMLGRLAGCPPETVDALVTQLVEDGHARRLGSLVVAEAEAHRLVRQARTEVERFHVRQPLEPGIDLSALAATLGIDPESLRVLLSGVPDVVVGETSVRLTSHAASTADDPEARTFLDALEAAPFSPPSPKEVGTPPSVVRALVREGAVVETEGVYFARDAYAEAVRRITAALSDGGTATVADVRDLLASSRKHVLPLLNHLDREGITRRKGDVREAGPRAAGSCRVTEPRAGNAASPQA